MSEGERRGLSRRGALIVIGGTAAGIAAGSLPSLAASARTRAAGAVVPGLRLAVPGASPSLSFTVVRPQDMLYLTVEFYNAKTVVTGCQTRVVIDNPAQPAYLAVVFPAQHVGEQAVVDFGTDLWPVPPLGGAFAGPSWLVFKLPAHASIPLTIDALLDWSGLAPQVVRPPASGPLAEPDPLHTALEVPWSVWLTPPPGGTWHHSAAPVSSSGRTELWHTRLGVAGAEPPTAIPLVKAVWATDYNTKPPPDPWPLMSLTPEDRRDIVTLTCGRVPGGGPAQAQFLALSALGAWTDLRGAWSPPETSGVSLGQWTHRASAGRDSYVRTARLGYLCPFGHRALYITITSRQFHVSGTGETAAYLMQESYVAPTEKVISYAGDPHEPLGGRGNPMRQVEVKTVASPLIDFDPLCQVGGFPLSDMTVFWVRSGGADVPFSFVATDIEGRTADFTTPVIWLDQTLANEADLTGSTPSAPGILDVYNAADPARNSPSLGGALFAFAETTGAVPGSTAHNVDEYTLNAIYTANGKANFYPVLYNPALGDPPTPPPIPGAAIRLPGAEQLAGGPLPVSPVVALHDNYLANGFNTALNQVYLQVLANVPGLSFPVDLVGGLAAPNIDIQGIARDLGPVAGDLSDLLNGTFDPASWFGSASGGIGKLLGAIPVAQIIEAVDPDAEAANAQAPKITSNFVYPPGNDITPVAVDTKLSWNPQVTADPLGFFQPGDTNLLITAEIYTPITNPAQATYSIHGELTNFTLVLFGDLPSADVASFIGIQFTSLTFDAQTGAKPSVNPQIATVSFLNALSFISDLEALLASLDGPSIDVTSAGITASYTLALPDVTVGVFSLSNLSLSATVNIPFDGSPVRFRFSLCSQDDPFLLTIYLFAGGGFFALAVGADGIEQIQVSLEFGAAISIDLGVASGGVSIMAGIYFSLATQSTQPKTLVQLTGFLRADGNLSVLGIISLSMEFYLGFTYLSPGQAYGEASVTVKVSVLFFSTSVTATMKKTIGGGSDPDFGQAISQADWDTYCEAFA